MARRSGPPPSEDRVRRNVDPLVGGDDWTRIPNAPYEGDVPEIPAWVTVSPRAEAFYAALACLPQAAAWSAGDWLSIHLTLPLLDRYLARPGAEAFKAIIAGLGAGPGLTVADLLKLRRKLVDPEQPDDSAAKPTKTTVRRLRVADPNTAAG